MPRCWGGLTLASLWALGFCCGCTPQAATGRGGPADVDAGGGGDPSGGDDGGGGSDDHSGSDGGHADSAALRLPPEAEDLDPAPGVVAVELVAAPLTRTVRNPHGDDILIEGAGYNGSSPGPTIRAQVGDRVQVTLRNDLAVPTTIHWHGLDVPFAMDGVVHGPGGTEDLAGLIAPGSSFTYSFTVDRPLTAWYHPHFDSAAQVQGGLFGALIVMDPAEPVVDHDLVLVVQDVPFDGLSAVDAAADSGAVSGSDPAAPHGAGHGASHGLGHSEGLWMVNGDPAPRLELPGGLRLRLRLINASAAGTLWLSGGEAGPLRVLARDQGLLPAVQSPDRELLAPGDRVELEVLPGASPWILTDHPYVHEGGAATGPASPLLTLEPQDASPPASPLAWPARAGAPTLDPGTTDIRWALQGSLSGDDWRINGEVFPEVTVAAGRVGAPLVIEVQNLSPTEHPFHLHGMAFEVLSVDGLAPTARRVEDTLNLGLYQRARLRVVPPAPGDWMAHCHILPHADGGMMTILRVTEPE